MSFRFENRVAIVTGAGAGLGRAHAKLLASRGAKVVVNDLASRDGGKSQAEAVVDEIRAEGGEAMSCHESVAEEASAARIVQAALDHFGRIDVVINNAGILRDKTFVKMDMADFELVLRVHLFGTAYVTKAAWPHLLQQKYGRVILTSSASGLGTAYGQANYGAAKAGMIGLMISLKNEGFKSNVLVNSICPIAATQMTDGLMSGRVTELALPEHVSPAVAWLASEECNVTGEIISAGLGYYGLIKIMKNEGVVIDPKRPASVEEFADRIERIFDLSASLPYAGTLDARTKAMIGLE